MKFHCKIAAIFSFMFFVLSLNLIKTNATQTEFTPPDNTSYYIATNSETFLEALKKANDNDVIVLKNSINFNEISISKNISIITNNKQIYSINYNSINIPENKSLNLYNLSLYSKGNYGYRINNKGELKLFNVNTGKINNDKSGTLCAINSNFYNGLENSGNATIIESNIHKNFNNYGKLNIQNFTIHGGSILTNYGELTVSDFKIENQNYINYSKVAQKIPHPKIDNQGDCTIENMEIKNNKLYHYEPIIFNKKILKIKECSITENTQYTIHNYHTIDKNYDMELHYDINPIIDYIYIKNSGKLYLDNVKINNKNSTSIYGGDCSIVNSKIDSIKSETGKENCQITNSEINEIKNYNLHMSGNSYVGLIQICSNQKITLDDTITSEKISAIELIDNYIFDKQILTSEKENVIRESFQKFRLQNPLFYINNKGCTDYQQWAKYQQTDKKTGIIISSDNPEISNLEIESEEPKNKNFKLKIEIENKNKNKINYFIYSDKNIKDLEFNIYIPHNNPYNLPAINTYGTNNKKISEKSISSTIVSNKPYINILLYT